MEYTIFAFKNGPESVRRQLYRKLYGYSVKEVKYPGVLSKCNGLKLGAGAIIVNAAYRKAVEDVLTKLNVDFFTLTVSGDEQLLNKPNNAPAPNPELQTPKQL